MGRRRSFDTDEVVRAAAALFAGRAYDSVSVDDLVAHLGVHRNSLYNVFGSKRGLYLAALGHSLDHDVAPFVDALAAGADPAGRLDLLLLAAVERAPVDAEVAAEVDRALTALDRAAARASDGAASSSDPAGDGGTGTGPGPGDVTATILGRRLRARIATR